MTSPVAILRMSPSSFPVLPRSWLVGPFVRCCPLSKQHVSGTQAPTKTYARGLLRTVLYRESTPSQKDKVCVGCTLRPFSSCLDWLLLSRLLVVFTSAQASDARRSDLFSPTRVAKPVLKAIAPSLCLEPISCRAFDGLHAHLTSRLHSKISVPNVCKSQNCRFSSHPDIGRSLTPHSQLEMLGQFSMNVYPAVLRGSQLIG